MFTFYAGMNNADISVRLGEIWKGMTHVQKQPYYDEAAKIKAEHKLKHPGRNYLHLFKSFVNSSNYSF